MSISSTGGHFTAIGKTTNEMIFAVEGMAQHQTNRIHAISKYSGRGQAIRMNQHNIKDQSELIGCHKNTVAVFYVLDMGSHAQGMFFNHQSSVLYDAIDFGSITILGSLNRVEFAKESSQRNLWVPCVAEDITWTSDRSKLNWEFKVLQLSLSLMFRKLSKRNCHQNSKNLLR
jgi:hypothetical protein